MINKTIIGQFSTGETIALALDWVGATDADVNASTNREAACKLMTGRTFEVPPETDPVAGTFVVSARAAANGVPAGFNLLMAAGLDTPGRYAVDVRWESGGVTVIADAVAFEIVPRVTP